MDRRELLARYEARGDERDFLTAKPFYERALAEAADAQSLLEYGYLLECQGRNQIRQAVAQYDRAIDADPSLDKAHYQWISAHAVADTQQVIDRYRSRLGAAPGDVREYRFLASAYLAAHEYGEAATIVARGLGLAPADAALISFRGEAKAGMGDAVGALDDWRQVIELDPEDAGPRYSSAFLLEREGRLVEAAETWRALIAWQEARGFTLDTEWPKREFERLRAALAEA